MPAINCVANICQHPVRNIDQTAISGGNVSHLPSETFWQKLTQNTGKVAARGLLFLRDKKISYILMWGKVNTDILPALPVRGNLQD